MRGGKLGDARPAGKCRIDSAERTHFIVGGRAHAAIEVKTVLKIKLYAASLRSWRHQNVAILFLERHQTDKLGVIR